MLPGLSNRQALGVAIIVVVAFWLYSRVPVARRALGGGA